MRFHIAQTKIFFADTFVSHPGGPNEQFGTHEKLPWGVQGNVNWMPGYLGLGGKASKNKLKDASFIFSMTNVTVLSIFRTHAQKEYHKVLEMKDTYILNIFALLLFENLQRIY